MSALASALLALLLLPARPRRRTPRPTETRPRARDLGLAPGVYEPGPLDAITDVAGVRVGHVTLVEGEAVRTGVTVVVPHAGNLFQDKVPGAVFVGNAFGKLAGSTQVRELGTIETPIVLTNTLAVGTAVEAIVGFTLAQPGNEAVRSVNALVGETNDGALNDIRAMRVTRADVLAALASAATGPVPEGSVGAGTGTVAFGWKGGIGTASRRLPADLGGYTLGVLVQANFGGVLMMDGVPVGRELGRRGRLARARPRRRRRFVSHRRGDRRPAVSARDLERLAARAVFGLARTGSSFSNGSGDYAVAFSTAQELRVRHGESPRADAAAERGLSPLFQAALETTEEAVLNALLRATSVSGMGAAWKRSRSTACAKHSPSTGPPSGACGREERAAPRS